MTRQKTSQTDAAVIGGLTPADDLERHVKSWFGHHGAVWTCWYVLGARGAVSFTLRTGAKLDTLAWGIDSHALERGENSMYEEGDKGTPCDLVPGGRCYSDGSALQGSELLEAVLASGDAERAPDVEIVWRTLCDRYARWIEGAEGD